MPRTITETRTVYKFEELSEEAQAKALEKQSEFEGETFSDFISYDDFDSICHILGIELRRRPWKNSYGFEGSSPAIYWSGFWSQGDGASFEGTYEYQKGSRKAIREYAPVDAELHRIADELYALQKPFFFGLMAEMKVSGHYVHSGCMSVDVTHKLDDAYNYKNWQDKKLPEDELTQLMRDLADWLYKCLEAEYEYRTGEESCRESIEANDYEFNEDGSLA